MTMPLLYTCDFSVWQIKCVSSSRFKADAAAVFVVRGVFESALASIPSTDASALNVKVVTAHSSLEGILCPFDVPPLLPFWEKGGLIEADYEYNTSAIPLEEVDLHDCYHSRRSS